MDVFITWSGPASLHLAEGLRDFLVRAIQAVRPFLSSEDIRKGQRWNEQIGAKLQSAKYAIVCLTKSNLDARWIHFEAGAISREIEGGVTSLFLDVDDTHVQGPLAQFQNTKATKEDIFKLVSALNSKLSDQQLPADVLADSMVRFWLDFESKIKEAKDMSAKGDVTKPPPRTTTELLEELLVTSRENARQLDDISKSVWTSVHHHMSRPTMELPSAAYAPPSHVSDIDNPSEFGPLEAWVRAFTAASGRRPTQKRLKELIESFDKEIAKEVAKNRPARMRKARKRI